MEVCKETWESKIVRKVTFTGSTLVAKLLTGMAASTLKRTHGPLIHTCAVQKDIRHVEDAVSKGASILVGGKPIGDPNTSFTPTVLFNVSPTALLRTEETFGPLASLTKFTTEDEVIQLANNTNVGLAGYFFSRDVGRVWRVVEALEVGMVGANMGLISQDVIPFGGVKERGVGREGEPHGIEEYLNEKIVVFGVGGWEVVGSGSGSGRRCLDSELFISIVTVVNHSENE
ncbi:hypothetical protein VNI00_018513 [Paramarasmius palmivorus]|uniref:Aldehyde dehydrogenase domain-containing protein n=1 Tax=Paramarasmius palmivorus TaxID=297713 RepID=A0AAW0AXI1_9AGAR